MFRDIPEANTMCVQEHMDVMHGQQVSYTSIRNKLQGIVYAFTQGLGIGGYASPSIGKGDGKKDAIVDDLPRDSTGKVVPVPLDPSDVEKLIRHCPWSIPKLLGSVAHSKLLLGG